MTIKIITEIRNAMLDAIETEIGVEPILTIRTGAAPENCAAEATGTVLATLNLPSNWMAAASGGSKLIYGTWEDLTADETGTAAHFRIKSGATCHIQGTVTVTGGGGDLELNSVSVTAGNKVTVTKFTIAAGNA